MRLRYDLTGTGWAECEVEIGDQRAVATASYLSDALGDLAGAVIEVLAGAPGSEASFAEEPGEYRWLFDRAGADGLRVRLLWFDDGPRARSRRGDHGGEVRLDAECRLSTFAGALVSEMQHLLAQSGPAGYRARWVQDGFPTRRLARLQALLAGLTPAPSPGAA